MSASRFAACIAIMIAFLAVAFVPAPARAAGPGGLYGGTAIVATTFVLDPDPLNLNPQNEPLHSLIYDSLGRASPTTLVPEPWLAESWDVNTTARTVTFHIRANAKWADGTALTAGAVNASYHRYLAASLLSGFDVIAPDAATAVFDFSIPGGKGGGDFMGKWVTLPIAYPDPTSPAKASGLFDLGTVVPGVSLEITANENHWHGRPYLDAILYQFHTGPTALDDAACDMIEKRIDFIGVPLTGDDLNAPRPCGGTLQNASLEHIFTARDAGFEFLHLGINTQNAPLDDPAFRVALTSALDRELTITIEPYSIVADSVVTPANTYWFNTSVPQYRVQKGVEGGRVITILDSVNDMLDTAGYLDRNGDGWRERPSGATFTVDFLHLNATTDPRQAKIQGISTNLKAIGINLIEKEDTPDRIQAAAQTHNFDLYLGTYDVESDPSFLFDLFHSTRRTAGRNYNNVADGALDTTLESVRDSLDLTARQKAARDAQGILGEKALAAPLVHYETIFVYNRERFEGWVSQPGGINNFWSFANLHVIPRGPLTVTMSPFTNSLAPPILSTTVIVTVRDSADLPVEDATVEMSGGTFSSTTGLTDANGRFQTTFTAPSVTQTQDITIQADVTRPGYDSASATTGITVHAVPQTLTVVVDRSKPILESGQASVITVTVVDPTAAPVEGASVTLVLTPDGVGGSLSALTGTTAANGTFRATLTSTSGTDTTYRITAIVSAAGFETATASTSVLAKMRGGAPPSVPALDTVAMVVVVAGAAFVFARWRNRRRKA